MKRVYVIEPYVPNGGTYMSYHLALILHLDFGFDPIAVSDAGTSSKHGIFVYSHEYPTVSTDQMMRDVRPEDILIANPSFSHYGFGERVKAIKIMYIQGFNTFSLLDCGFDHYVSVSTFVQSFIQNVYSIATEVIPAFIEVSPSVPRKPWGDRPREPFFVWTKNHSPLLRALFARLQQALPEYRLAPSLPERITHDQFITKLGERRYFLTLSATEGFGLPALEAMAMGTTVIGFDGFGGRDYMKSNINCSVRPFPDVDGVAEAVRLLVANPDQAERMAEAGTRTATEYRFTYNAFQAAWRKRFQQIINR